MAIDWLRVTHPGSIIVTELSVADWRGASLDLAAITETHIAGIEIKGEGDSPARLDRQGLAYGMVAREMWLLCDMSLQEKCFSRRPAGWGRLEIHEGIVRPYNVAKKLGPLKKHPLGGTYYPTVRDESRYEPDRWYPQEHQSPHVMCGTLWRDELCAIAKCYQLCSASKAPVHVLTKALCDALPAPLLHDEMIKALRRRVWRRPVIDLRGAK
ncbi:hypothetical protein [Rhodobium gokarnense]|uniref:Uncharacterized protein n=1 Tax=Rhodobium gokarnense TaxID=364296 RepID=A0ABT3HH25_9HYPH|nr:hypothetical protein [Rhodobium gokarnense]MCW2309701.1 hypothetical protein [Rhodobium gokarnense]